jgi:hypothetical protein
MDFAKLFVNCGICAGFAYNVTTQDFLCLRSGEPCQ